MDPWFWTLGFGLPETVKPVEQKEPNAGKRGLGVMRQRKEKGTKKSEEKTSKRKNKGLHYRPIHFTIEMDENA